MPQRLLYLICALCGLVTGYYIAKGTITSTVETKVETRVEYRDRIVEKKSEEIQKHQKVQKTVETKPNGTKVVSKVITTDVNDHKSEQSDKEVSSSTSEKVTRTDEKPQYRAKIDVDPRNYRDFGVSIGRRVVGPVWGEVGYRPKGKEVRIGVGVEF